MISQMTNNCYFPCAHTHRGKEKLAFTSICVFHLFFSWIISEFGLKLWLHISMSGSIIGTLVQDPSGSSFPYNRNARDETADIAHPREDESTSWPPKGWSSSFRFSSVCLTSFSKSRRKWHLLFTWSWCEEIISISKMSPKKLWVIQPGDQSLVKRNVQFGWAIQGKQMAKRQSACHAKLSDKHINMDLHEGENRTHVYQDNFRSLFNPCVEQGLNNFA